MREWLTVIIVLLIVTVVLDGLRRMRNNRRNSLRMSKNVNRVEPDSTQPLPQFTSELPNGGARIVSVRKADADQSAQQKPQQKSTRQSIQPVSQAAQQQRAANAKPAEKNPPPKPAQRIPQQRIPQQRIPQQVALNLDEHVPMLMDSVEQPRDLLAADNSADTNADKREPQFELDAATSSYSEPGRIEPSFASETKQPAQPAQEPAEPDLVLVINVMARKGEYFTGSELLQLVLNCGMRYGSMNIFHHHLGDNGEGEVLYSMANIVVPGTFDLNAMDDFYTPGVSLFMMLPLEAETKLAFDAMLHTAKSIAGQLQGELKDENRSVLTPQTIEHYRSRIKEYERKQLSKTPA